MERYPLMQKEAGTEHDSMKPNQAGQSAGTRRSRGRAGQGCAGQRQETVLADLARMSELQHDNIPHVHRQ